jgi:Zn-finger protein
LNKKKIKLFFAYSISCLLILGSVLLSFPYQIAYSITEDGSTEGEPADSPSGEFQVIEPDALLNDPLPNEPLVDTDVETDTIYSETPFEPASEPDLLSESNSASNLTAPILSRPFVLDIQIVSKDNTLSLPGDDMTQVPVDAKIQVTIRDDNLADHPIPFILNYNNTEKVNLNVQRLLDESGDYVFIIVPSEGSLSYNETYYLYVDPTLGDLDGNLIFSRVIKFTTQSNPHRNFFYRDNPHGFYMSNTNMCANCHSTHVKNTPTIGDNKYPVSENMENYCMACHDGTMGIPMADKLSDTNKHFEYSADSEENIHQSMVSSCTNCHNPHLSWNAENPNLLKNHFVYDHNQLDNPKAVGIGIQDSEDVICETCHDTDLSKEKRIATNKVFHYQKNLWTSNSIKTDTPICLKCHNSINELKNAKIIDIEKYYNDTNSGHFITTTLPDGTEIQGQMPCSDCHETHGSTVLKQLKDSLGNAPVADTDKFKTIGTDWTAVDERTFCIKCHNGNTDLYKKTPILPDLDTLNQPIPGHQSEDLQACSSCHSNEMAESGFMEQSISGAHAPKKLKPAP